MAVKYPAAKCPAIIPDIREIGDYVTEHGRTIYKVTKRIDRGLKPCLCTSLKLIDAQPFSSRNGIDSGTKKVECLACGCEYFIFPIIRKRVEKL